MTAGLDNREQVSDRFGERRSDGLTCIVADDHPVVLEAVCALLESRGLTVQGRARDGETALALIAEHRPPVALVDLRLPGMSGSDAAREAQRLSPQTSVIVYTGQSDVACMTEVLDAGAKGFVLKDAPLEDLMRAIDMVAAGGVYVDPALAGVFVDAKGTGRLTPREREVHPPGRRGSLEREDRRAAVPVPADRARPRRQRHGQAPGAHPDAGRRDRSARAAHRLGR